AGRARVSNGRARSAPDAGPRASTRIGAAVVEPALSWLGCSARRRGGVRRPAPRSGSAVIRPRARWNGVLSFRIDRAREVLPPRASDPDERCRHAAGRLAAGGALTAGW